MMPKWRILLMTLALVGLVSMSSLAETVVQLEAGMYLGPGYALSVQTDHFYGRGTFSGIVFMSGGGYMPHISGGVNVNLYENDVVKINGQLGAYVMTSYNPFDDIWGEELGLGVESRAQLTLKLTEWLGVGVWVGGNVPLMVYDTLRDYVAYYPFLLPQGGLGVQVGF